MKNYLMIPAILVLTACGGFKSTDAGSVAATTSTVVPKLSQAVGQAQSASMEVIRTAATPVPFGCPDCANFQNVKTAMKGTATVGIVQAMLLPDLMSCRDEVVVHAFHPELLNSGGYLYIAGGSDDPTGRSRIKINAPNGKLQSYQSIYCGGNDSTPYQVYNSLNATVTNNSISFTYKIPSAVAINGQGMLIQANGVYQNGMWLSKSATEDTSGTVEDVHMALNDFGTYQIVQESYVDKSDATQNILLWAQLAVAGSTYQNLVFGNGSVNIQLGAASPNVVSWNMGTDSESTSGQYQTAAAASTLPTVATDMTVTDTSGWDCTIPADAIVITTNQRNEAAANCTSDF